MTQLQALNIRITADSADLQAELTAAKAKLVEFETAAGRAPIAVNNFGGSLTRLGNISNSTRSKIQNAGFQIQDAAIQMQMGTRASVIMAQQGSQLASAFGPVGMVLGTLAAVGIPLVAAAMTALGTNTAVLKDSMEGLKDSLEALNQVAKNYSADGIQKMIDKYGEVNIEILAMIENQRQFAVNTAMQASVEAIKSLRNEFSGLEASMELLSRPGGGLTGILEQLGLTKEQFVQLRKAMDEASKATTFEAQAEALRKVNSLLAESDISMTEVAKAALDAEDSMRQLAQSAPEASWMGSAISGVLALGEAIRGRIAEVLELRGQAIGGGSYEVGKYDGGPDAARSRLNGGGAFAPPVRGAGLVTPRTSGGGSGGGGGGGMEAELERFRETIMAKETLQVEAYARQQEMLLAAKNQELITQQEYDQYIRDAAIMHGNEMAQIKERESEMVRSASKAMYGELEGLLGMFAGKSKAAAIAAIALNKGLRIAEIIQNTAAAQMRAFAELGPVAGAAAAAKIGLMGKIQAGIVAATGLAQAAGAGSGGGGGIGGGGGGGRGAGGGQASSSSPTAGTYLNFQFVGGLTSPEEVGRFLVEAINSAIGNGAVIRGARVT